MTHPDTAARDAGPADVAGTSTSTSTGASTGTDTTDRLVSPDAEPDAPASPWDGIPPELLYALWGSYDTDSAGGCG